MRRRVAIVGAGITLFRRRMLESPKELSFEASKMALDSAGLTLKDIQSVVSGSAPDAFVGLSDSSHSVKIVFSFHVDSVEGVWCGA